MSKWLLVELDDPHGDARTEVFGLAHRPGIRGVTDLEVLSRVTLDQWLLPADQTWAYKRRRDGTPYNAIRNYHKNKRQPKLL